MHWNIYILLASASITCLIKGVSYWVRIHSIPFRTLRGKSICRLMLVYFENKLISGECFKEIIIDIFKCITQ